MMGLVKKYYAYLSSILAFVQPSMISLISFEATLSKHSGLIPCATPIEQQYYCYKEKINAGGKNMNLK